MRGVTMPGGRAFLCALDWLLQPVLLDSTTSSCYCTFSSNFCVAMATQKVQQHDDTCIHIYFRPGYIYIYVCICMRMYMCVHVCVYRCMCICMYMYICVSVYMYAYTFIYARVWVYICTRVGAFCLFVLSNLSTTCACITCVS